jgi:hypothetical protein
MLTKFFIFVLRALLKQEHVRDFYFCAKIPAHLAAKTAVRPRRAGTSFARALRGRSGEGPAHFKPGKVAPGLHPLG